MLHGPIHFSVRYFWLDPFQSTTRFYSSTCQFDRESNSFVNRNILALFQNIKPSEYGIHTVETIFYLAQANIKSACPRQTRILKYTFKMIVQLFVMLFEFH